MVTLPLYPQRPIAPIEAESPSACKADCSRCALGDSARVVCAAPTTQDAQRTGDVLLVIADRVERSEQYAVDPRARVPRLIRDTLESNWTGPVVYDAAVRCDSTADEAATAMPSCRTYLAQVWADVRPARVIALGPLAAEAVLGFRLDNMNARRGYAYVGDVPVISVTFPLAAARNRFLRTMLTDDLTWAATATLEPPPWSAVYHRIQTPADAAAAVSALSGGFAFDVETCGTLYNADFRLLCLAASSLGSDTAYVWTAAELAQPSTRAALTRLLSDPAVPKVAHNAKYDLQAMLAAEDVRTEGFARDTMMWRKLEQGDALVALDICSELVGMGGHKAEAQAVVKEAVAAIRKEQRLGVGPKGEAEAYAYARIPQDVLLRYCCRDTVATSRLDRRQLAVLSGSPQERVWSLIVRPATEALLEVERAGALVSIPALNALDQHLSVSLASIRGQFDSVGLVNPNSSQQVARLLYDYLELPCPKTTATGARSTDSDVLESLQGKHPIVDALLNWRGLSKLQGTYVEGMREHIREDGRIHTSYLLHGTETGRLSSRNPNLQNIPRADTPEGKMARDVFVAADGHSLVQLDYSQLELRVAAMLSGDPAMLDIFASGEDYHMRTAQMIAPFAWGVRDWAALDAATKKKYRSGAKAVNFGLLYGRGDKALAKGIGCTADEAAKIRRAVLGQFTSLDRWINQMRDRAQRSGETWTWWDGEPARRRPLWRIGEPDSGVAGNAERSAWNTPIQGTGSEFCLASVAECVKWLREDCVPAKLVLTVHDSIVFEVLDEAVPEVVAGARAIMEGWPSKGVHLAVDAEVGKSWGSLSAYKGT